MARFKHPLDHVQVAAPCKADWNQMVGSELVRLCGQCELNVYNLSGMSRLEAESLIARTEGRLCVRFYRRRDGSIITRDCPVGLRAIQRRVSYLAQAILAAGFAFLASIGVQGLISKYALVEEHTVGIMVRPVVPSPFTAEPVMGKAMIPRPHRSPKAK
ncbi:MAG TPA: hypothetical protein VKD91_00180 [Pyrinomonadaceae bacterium]|nr:hypothetical protein [Pyrinomonadaceae bacterium]